MFGGGQVKYDRALTVFSPEGRLYQVEYALEAVRRGTLAVAVKSEKDVCLAAQIKIPSPLMEADSIDKIFQIDEHIGVAISGLHADSRALINYSRVQAQSFRLTYDEPVRLNMLVKTIADLYQIYTQYGGIRPFGVAFIIGGIDEMGIHMFETDPSGAYKKYSAGIIGAGKEDADPVFEDQFKENMSFNNAINLSFDAVTTALKKKIKSINLEIVTITKKDMFKRLTDDEVTELKKKY